MIVAKIMEKMIKYSNGSFHDINHFIKVWGYAKTIGEEEQLDSSTILTLEIAAIIHDIACPSLREKYGLAEGKLQEKEGVILAKEFLSDEDLSPSIKERIIYLVGHHHTLTNIDGIDYQILVEADYLVNADESKYNLDNLINARKHIFKTNSGKRIFDSLFPNVL